MAGSTAKRTSVAEEQVWCYQQRLRGLSLRAIAEASETECPAGRPMSLKTVHRRIESEIAIRVQPRAAELRQMELDRLDDQEILVKAVQDRVHVKTNGGEIVRDPETGEALIDDAPVLAANDRLLRIQERRAKLLGIEAPTQIVTDATVRYEIVGVDIDKL